MIGGGGPTWYPVRVSLRAVLLVIAVAGLSACAGLFATEQRTTQGPTAEQLWTLRMVTLNGRAPSFEEHQHWDDQLERRVSEYLRQHQEAANSVDVSIFRYDRRVAVGMTKEQVMILLDVPVATTTDAAEMEKLARAYWPLIKGNATEAWVYPLGWSLYFAGGRLVDMTQYLRPY